MGTTKLGPLSSLRDSPHVKPTKGAHLMGVEGTNSENEKPVSTGHGPILE